MPCQHPTHRDRSWPGPAVGLRSLLMNPDPCIPQPRFDMQPGSAGDDPGRPEDAGPRVRPDRGAPAIAALDVLTPSRVLVGESPAMRALRHEIDQCANSPFPVLIEGESGSGKDIVAALLHARSERHDRPALALNCAALSPTLLEPTLFGHARGAFTGATSARAGYFEDSGDGTLFLDEIGELSLELQPKLLRVLESGEFQRVGETRSHNSRARVIAATNRDLRQEVKRGRFRADLYQRLSVFRLQVPPLRHCADDRILLLEHFLQRQQLERGNAPFQFEPEARALWQTYEFPGNVRELRNIVIRLSTRHSGSRVSARMLAAEFDQATLDAHLDRSCTEAADDPVSMQACAQSHLARGDAFSLDHLLHTVEQGYIKAAMHLAGGNVSHAARLLGINRTTLYSRMDAQPRASALR